MGGRYQYKSPLSSYFFLYSYSRSIKVVPVDFLCVGSHVYCMSSSMISLCCAYSWWDPCFMWIDLTWFKCSSCNLHFSMMIFDFMRWIDQHAYYYIWWNDMYSPNCCVKFVWVGEGRSSHVYVSWWVPCISELEDAIPDSSCFVYHVYRWSWSFLILNEAWSELCICRFCTFF